MKFLRSLLSVALVLSHFVSSARDHGVYYSELKAFKKAAETKAIFIHEYSNSPQGALIHEHKETVEQESYITLSSIQKDILMCKSLSLFQVILQSNLFKLDLIIVAPDTLPALYEYLHSMCEKAAIPMPTIFVTRKKGRLSIFSQKFLMFSGTIVIGQQLLHDLSDNELEAVLAREAGSIKYNHTNKMLLLGVICVIICRSLLKVMEIQSNKIALSKGSSIDVDNLQKLLDLYIKLLDLCTMWFIPLLVLTKRFEKEADEFACKILGKSKELIAFCNRLEERAQFKKAEFIHTYDLLQENKSRMSLLLYIPLMLRYYGAKVLDCLDHIVDPLFKSSPEARIAAVKKYLAKQAA